MGEEAPSDLANVRYAFRLGWAIAELRGRYQTDRYDKRDPGTGKAFKRGGFQLPLSSERSPAEIRKELLETVDELSKELALDKSAEVAKAWTTLKAMLEHMEDPNEDRLALWPTATKCFFLWDAHIQDALVLEATHAAGYQLGRGLAETYWALEPDRADDEMGSWTFVLGERRRQILQRLAARLSAYLSPPVVAAIEKPLTDWSMLAADPNRRSQEGVDVDLYRQGLMWRDLVRGERRPQDLALNEDVEAPTTADVWKVLHLYRYAVKSLWIPLTAGLVSIAALTAGAAVLASGSGSSTWSTAISVLGALGVTSAALYAHAKTDVTSLLGNLKKRIEIERVRLAADLCPGREAKATQKQLAASQARSA
jgi:hypothetical protein